MADKEAQARNLLQRVVKELIDQVAWVRKVLSNEQSRKAIEDDLGISLGNRQPPPESASIAAYRKAATDGDQISKQAALQALADILSAYDAIAGMVEAGIEGKAEGGAAGAGKELAREAAGRLLSLLTLSYARLRWPRLYKWGQLLSFIEEVSSTNLTEQVYFDRFPELLGTGCDYVKRYIGPLETEADAKILSDDWFVILAGLMGWQGNEEESHGGKQFLPDFFATKNIIYGWDAAPNSTAPVADALAARTLSVSFHYRKQEAAEGSAIEGELNLTLLFVPRSAGGPGVFINIGGAGALEGKINDDWRLKIETRAEGPLNFLLGANVAADGSVDSSVRVTVEPTAKTVGPPGVDAAVAAGQKHVFPDESGMRLEFGRLSFTGELSQRGAGLEVVAEDGVFVISSAECDGFVAEVMPGERKTPADGKGPAAKETRVNFNLGLGLSSERGFYLTSGSGLQAVIPVGKTVGPATIRQILLRLSPSTDPRPARLAAEVSAALSVKLGPVTATVDQIGLRALVPFARNDKGKVDISIGFKPPTGVGLKIESDAVTGGGFLFYDAERAQYGGVVHLEFSKSKMALKAVGLISTRLPGGAKGFSMIILVTAEGFKGIPLGLGFRLTGVGGLLAVNRTFNEEAMSEGVKSGALRSVLFPKDPVNNAPQIINSLDAFFPANKGSFLIGLLAQISWGTDSLVKMELGLVFETGRRLRIIVLGRVTVAAPTEENDLLRLNMDAVGVIDFDQGTARLDAALYDSRLLKKFVLTGQMAMRLRTKQSPIFALSVGGFHPAFKAPPEIPALERIALSLGESENFRLRCECYFALTSNTLQFGAHAELFAKAGGFSIHGAIGFDVLIQFDPFRFIISFHASVQLKRGSTNLFKVKVSGELSGARPLHVKGKATFEIFWCDFSVGFSKTLVSGEPPPRPQPVRVMERLRPALADAHNWGGKLPDGAGRLVTLRERARPEEVPLHPLGKLSFKQTVVPLDLEIDRFGPARPADGRLFKLSSVSVGGTKVEFERERDFFSPAEFLDMTDDEKLSAPSFERLTAGFTLSADDFIIPADDLLLEEPSIRYETIVIDQIDKPAPKPSKPAPLNPGQLGRQILFGAAARSDVRRAVGAKYSPGGPRRVLAKSGWKVVSAVDGTDQAVVGIEKGKLVAYAEAFQALKKEKPARARALKIVSASE